MLTRVLIHILLLSLAFILQSTWVHSLAVAQIAPDLMVLALVYVSLDSSRIQGALLGFWAGLIQDFQAPENLGLNALSKCVVAFAAGSGKGKIVTDSQAVQMAFAAGAVLIHDVVYYTCCRGQDWSIVPYFWIRYSVGTAFYTALVSIVLSGLLNLRRRILPLA